MRDIYGSLVIPLSIIVILNVALYSDQDKGFTKAGFVKNLITVLLAVTLIQLYAS